MNLDIDTNVTFTLKEGRKATVDALEFDDFIRGLGELKQGENPDGTPKVDAAGKPVMYRIPDWPVVEKQMTEWFKEKANVDLNRSEVHAIWSVGWTVWAKKNESWQEPEPAAAPLISPSSTDLRHSD